MAEWRYIPGFPFYQISDEGQLRSVDRVVKHKGTGTARRRGVPMAGCKTTFGHLSTLLSDVEGVRSSHLIHRLVMLAFVGPCPPGLEVCHNDGVPDNNRLSNLRYDTRKSNINDITLHGNWPHQDKCRNGHPRSPENWYITKTSRTCAACRQIWLRKNQYKTDRTRTRATT